MFNKCIKEGCVIKMLKFLSFIIPFIIGAFITIVFDPFDKYEKFLENSKQRGIKRYQKKLTKKIRHIAK